MKVYIQDDSGVPIKFTAKLEQDSSIPFLTEVGDGDSIHSVVDDLCLQKYGHNSFQIDFL